MNTFICVSTMGNFITLNKRNTFISIDLKLSPGFIWSSPVPHPKSLLRQVLIHVNKNYFLHQLVLGPEKKKTSVSCLKNINVLRPKMKSRTQSSKGCFPNNKRDTNGFPKMECFTRYMESMMPPGNSTHMNFIYEDISCIRWSPPLNIRRGFHLKKKKSHERQVI